MNLRLKFWHWILATINYPEAKILNLPLRILWVFFFPIKTITYHTYKSHGFDWKSQTWNIHGIKYSDSLFRNLGIAKLNEPFMIIQKEDGLITIKHLEEPIHKRIARDHMEKYTDVNLQQLKEDYNDWRYL
jgi:hypothetical protein